MIARLPNSIILLFILAFVMIKNIKISSLNNFKQLQLVSNGLHMVISDIPSWFSFHYRLNLRFLMKILYVVTAIQHKQLLHGNKVVE